MLLLVLLLMLLLLLLLLSLTRMHAQQSCSARLSDAAAASSA
jgi:hypothetical protein